MYEEGYLSRENQIAKPTRKKEKFYLTAYIVPRWGTLRLNQIHPKAVGDWLHTTFDSWWTMHGVRAIMSRVFYYAEGHGLWEEGKRSPAGKAKLGKKHYKYERRILSFDETARVLARLEDTIRLIIEICIATGARISEVLGLKWKHVNFDAGTIKIEQRVWHQDIGRPKSEDSERILGIGDLVERLRSKATEDRATPQAFVFQQKRAPGKPLWDSGVRDALHQAAEAEGCDFPGLGPHSFRRVNITWRQQVGGSAIEASKIAGHSDLEMTGEYTFVTPERQNELTRRIQQKLAEAKEKAAEAPSKKPAAPPDGTRVVQFLCRGMLAIELVRPASDDYELVEPRLKRNDQPAERILDAIHECFPNSGFKIRRLISSACSRPLAGWTEASSQTCRTSDTGRSSRRTAARNTASLFDGTRT